MFICGWRMKRALWWFDTIWKPTGLPLGLKSMKPRANFIFWTVPWWISQWNLFPWRRRNEKNVNQRVRCKSKPLKVWAFCFPWNKVNGNNWTQWQQWVSESLQRLKYWSLSTGQKAQYLMIYYIPAWNYLAVIFPPPKSMTAAVTRDIFKWLFRTLTFPVVRLVMQRKEREGGLRLVDISLWFLALFLYLNCGPWNTIKDSYWRLWKDIYVWIFFYL